MSNRLRAVFAILVITALFLGSLSIVEVNTDRKEFTQMHGLSPARYRNNCRIEAAKRLLLSGHSCIEVASRLNYADVYTFSHRFKKEVSLSPTAFIKAKL